MFAVMKTGGKQYKVQSGDVLRVEKLAADAGETVQFNEILMLGGDKTVVGAPLVNGAAVQAEVIDQVKKTFSEARDDAEVFVYPGGVEHGYMLPGHGAAYNEAAAEQSWERTLDLLKKI